VHDEWGIADGYFDVDGGWHDTPARTRERLREVMGRPQPGPPVWFVPAGEAARLHDPCRIDLEDGASIGVVTQLPADLPLGYHDLVPTNGGPTTRLIVHPRTCPAPPRAWGVAAQIYALWSERSWGIGDLGDLAAVAVRLREAGGSAILISPLHQPAPSLPQEDSPYYPSSRRAWNPLLLSIDAPPPGELRCTADTLIDRDAVWRAKRAALSGTVRADRSAPDLVAFWNALCDELGPEWRAWPERVRRPDELALRERFAADADFAARVRFHQGCQEAVRDQLDPFGSLGVDLIGDLAVGFSPNGADAWEYQDLLALEVRIGAPPDPFSLDGQDWGIPPFIPWRVRNAGYRPFIETIRAALRGVRGLRIDHVMGLFRQFWIPLGTPASEGAYVQFPAEELLALLCLEATRAGAFVIGEDLGTVEPTVRESLAARNVAGTRVLWFEDAAPSEWPAGCLATCTTHDLPTIAGVVAGTDGDDEQRARIAALAAEELDGPASAIIADVHEELLGSPCALRLMTLDDLCAATERPNHPGTIDRPNWRRRLPLPVDEITMLGVTEPVPAS
jgi:4-alpha-glucanotransferase